jgi:hypothetical protein
LKPGYKKNVYHYIEKFGHKDVAFIDHRLIHWSDPWDSEFSSEAEKQDRNAICYCAYLTGFEVHLLHMQIHCCKFNHAAVVTNMKR